MTADPLATTPRLAPWHWALPFIMAAITAPLWLGWFEPFLFLFINRQLMMVPDTVWAWFSLLGTGWAVYALASPSLWCSPRIITAVLCATPLAGGLTRLGKLVAHTPRPLEVLGTQDVHVIGIPLFMAGMPSGHTLTAFTAATAIYFSLAPAVRLRFLWLFALALGVGLSRIAVGAHWPADVSVGAALGIFCGLVGVWLCSFIKVQHLQPQRWLMRGVAAFGVMCLYILGTDEMGFVINKPYQYLLAAFLGVCLLVFVRHSLLSGKQPH
ncbi:MAG: phosphatase PAP2 family protein [Gammaproteobacteria bacterium]